MLSVGHLNNRCSKLSALTTLSNLWHLAVCSGQFAITLVFIGQTKCRETQNDGVAVVIYIDKYKRRNFLGEKFPESLGHHNVEST